MRKIYLSSNAPEEWHNFRQVIEHEQDAVVYDSSVDDVGERLTDDPLTADIIANNVVAIATCDLFIMLINPCQPMTDVLIEYGVAMLAKRPIAIIRMNKLRAMPKSQYLPTNYDSLIDGSDGPR